MLLIIYSRLRQFLTITVSFLFVFLSVIPNAWAITVSGFDIPDGQAIETVKPSAEAGNARSQFTLGYLYFTQHNIEQALYWLKKSAHQHNSNAEAQLGLIYANGLQQSINYKKAYYYFLASAKQGNPIGENGLGTMYAEGNYINTNYAQAKMWFLKAAHQGYSEATYNLGEMYFYGELGKPNIQKGLALFKESALKGYPYAQYKLSALYGANKFGIKQDFQKAIKWFFVSQINGQEDTDQMGPVIDEIEQTTPYCIAQAQIGVATFYEQGVAGLPQSLHQAMQWLIKANQLSPDLAQVQLPIAAFSLRHGHDALAYQHAVLAAKQPFGNAQQFLGMLYQKGLGVDKDLVKASAWYQMALYTYAHPATDFYKVFVKECRPSTAPTEVLNPKAAQQQLALLNQQLNASQQQAAKELYEKLKAEQADSIEKFIKVNSGSH